MFAVMLRAVLMTTALVGSVILTGCAATETQESTGELVDSAAITAKIKTRLAEDPVTKATQIEVETFKDQVQLSGFVDSRDQIDRAEAIAAGVEGVQSVDNSLILRPGRETAGEYLDNATVTARIKAALLADTTTDGLDIEVETVKGVVQLSGFVDSEQQKQRAEQITREVRGVAAVKNSLIVR